MDRSGDEFKQPRPKLDYLNVADYLKIIEKKANWPGFEPVFRRREDVRRFLESFGDYRNAVMHSREMSELARIGGEGALVWLASVLPTEEDDVEPEEAAAESG